MIDFNNRHARIEMAVTATRWIAGASPAEDVRRVRQHYAWFVCPVEGHSFTPNGTCVFCEEYYEATDTLVYRDGVLVGAVGGKMWL